MAKRSVKRHERHEPLIQPGDPDPPLRVEVWPDPIRAKQWVDAEGTHWRLRGEGSISAKRLEHLLGSPDVEVLLFYGTGDPSPVPPGDRERLWRRIRPYIEGRGPRTDQTDFWAAEFKDDRRRSLLIIEESC